LSKKLGLILEKTDIVNIDHENDGDAAWAQPDFLQT